MWRPWRKNVPDLERGDWQPPHERASSKSSKGSRAKRTRRPVFFPTGVVSWDDLVPCTPEDVSGLRAHRDVY